MKKLFLLMVLILIAKNGVSNAQTIEGKASYYGIEACKYNKDPKCPTASGDSLFSLIQNSTPFAAMWGVEFGTRVRVCNSENKRCTTVIILDRGPNKRFRPKRVIDLSERSFRLIADPKEGLADVYAEVLR